MRVKFVYGCVTTHKFKMHAMCVTNQLNLSYFQQTKMSDPSPIRICDKLSLSIHFIDFLMRDVLTKF